VIQRICPFNPHIWKNLINTSSVRTDKENQQNFSPTSRGNISQESSTDNGKPGDHFSLMLTVHSALENWVNAWQACDLDTYLSAYSEDFIPSGNMNLAEWKKNRIKNLTEPEYIRIKLVNPVIEILKQTRVVITFKQIYTTETYRDAVMKTLTMKSESGKWRIINEQVTKTLVK